MANQLGPEGFGHAARSFFGWVAKWGDVLTTIVFLSAVILYGLNRIIAQQSKPNTALMWALACMGAGALLGFLFGIPRVRQGDNPPPGTAGGSGAAAGAGDAAGRTGADGQPAGGGEATESYSQLVNTNLEQISDWLTKIIVGLGLVELRNIPDYIRGTAAYVAREGFDPQSETFAAALIVYFSVIGFIGGYLTTRLWLAGAFSRADRMSSGLPLTGRERHNIQRSELTLDDGGGPQLAGMSAETARRATSAPLDSLTSPNEVAIWAKSQFKIGDYGEAVRGYAKAVALAPNNVRYRLEYAAALYYSGRPAESKEQLTEAYTRVRNTPGVDPNLKRDVYKSLTFQSLYVPPPVGFGDAIKYGEEFFAEEGQSASIATNLAAAYGQQYKWLTENGGTADTLTAARDEALKYVRLAISIKEGAKERLRMLLQKDYAGKDPKEDDLEVFERDEEFRRALDLPLLPPALPGLTTAPPPAQNAGPGGQA